jgi:hypothetical protein
MKIIPVIDGSSFRSRRCIDIVVAAMDTSNMAIAIKIIDSILVNDYGTKIMTTGFSMMTTRATIDGSSSYWSYRYHCSH